MTPDQQLPVDEPGPGESQADFERRTGTAPTATAEAPAKTAAELRAELEAAEAAEAAAQHSAVADQQPPPPGAAAQAVASGTGAQVPDAIAQAPVGSLGQPQEAAPAMEITHSEPILAQGATGEPVLRLVRLLAHAGFATNSIVNADPANVHQALDATDMADVERFWAAHPEARESDELYQGREAGVRELQGDWVGPHTWQVLYDLAGTAA